MKKAAIALLITISLLLVACGGDPTLDTSSKETMKLSMQEMMVKLSPEDQKKLQESVTGLYMIEAISSMGKKDGEQIQKEVGAKLNGKTAKEIFAMAEEVRKKMKKK